MTFKTDWLPTDTYDVKVDFVRIFGNAERLIKTGATWDSLSVQTWGDLSARTWGATGGSSYDIKTDWDYSDVIYKSYFTTLISALNYFLIRTLKKNEWVISSANITLNARLLNTIERTEEKIYHEIYG